MKNRQKVIKRSTAIQIMKITSRDGRTVVYQYTTRAGDRLLSVPIAVKLHCGDGIWLIDSCICSFSSSVCLTDRKPPPPSFSVSSTFFQQQWKKVNRDMYVVVKPILIRCHLIAGTVKKDNTSAARSSITGHRNAVTCLQQSSSLSLVVMFTTYQCLLSFNILDMTWEVRA